MKEFMVVFQTEEGTGASFYDNLMDADNARMDLECGLGYYAEVYRRVKAEDGMEEYKFLYC